MWAEEVQSFGVRFLDEDGAFVEMAVVDGLSGLTCPCPWLHLDIIDTVMWAWLAGMPSGELAVPAGWERPDEGSMRFIPNEEMEGLPVVARSGIDVLADPETGEPVYVGRPFEAAQDYDVILRRRRNRSRSSGGPRRLTGCSWLPRSARWTSAWPECSGCCVRATDGSAVRLGEEGVGGVSDNDDAGEEAPLRVMFLLGRGMVMRTDASMSPRLPSRREVSGGQSWALPSAVLARETGNLPRPGDAGSLGISAGSQ
jgi:hypothetical protein